MHSIRRENDQEINYLNKIIEDLRIEIKAKDKIIKNYFEKEQEFQDKDKLIASLNMDIYKLQQKLEAHSGYEKQNFPLQNDVDSLSAKNLEL